jgi:hypothetical protein
MTTPSQLANRSLLTSRQPAPKYYSIFGLLIFFIRNKKQFPFLERFAQYTLSTWLISQTCRNGLPAKTTWRFWVCNILASSTDRFIQGLSIFLPPFSESQSTNFRIEIQNQFYLHSQSTDFRQKFGIILTPAYFPNMQERLLPATTWRSRARNILALSINRFIQGLSIFLPPFSAHQFQALSFRMNLTPANFLADILVSTKTIKLCCLSIG